MHMDNINDLNKVRQKMFEIIFQFSQIDDICKKIITDFDAESIDKLVNTIQEYQTNTEKLQAYLHDYISRLIDQENQDYSLEDTEEGYKI